MCNKCILHASRAYAYIQQCLKSDAVLRERLALELSEKQIGESVDEQNIDEEQELYTEYDVYTNEEEALDTDKVSANKRIYVPLVLQLTVRLNTNFTLS